VAAAGIQNGDLIMIMRDPAGADSAPAAAPSRDTGQPLSEPLALRLRPEDGSAVNPLAFIDHITNRGARSQCMAGCSLEHTACPATSEPSLSANLAVADAAGIDED
jgi:hypothetical protein